MGAADALVSARTIAVLLFVSMAYAKQLTCGHTWCISTVTVEPALTGQFPAAREAPALQRTSFEATLVTGELEPGLLAH
jgi:hypothetical protein